MTGKKKNLFLLSDRFASLVDELDCAIHLSEKSDDIVMLQQLKESASQLSKEIQDRALRGLSSLDDCDLIRVSFLADKVMSSTSIDLFIRTILMRLLGMLEEFKNSLGPASSGGQS